MACHRCRQLIGLSRKGRLAYMNPAPLECLSLAAVSPLFPQLKQFSIFSNRFTAQESCWVNAYRSIMAYPNDRDEPGPSWRSRRHRRGSSTSSGSFGTNDSDEDSVTPWRGSQRLHDPRVRRAGSLPPDPRRSRALPEFQYEPLGDGHIRVLRVLSGNKQARLRCELDYTSLRRPRPFIALSYAWGDKYDTTEIELNRGVFSITTSLHGALRAVREPDRDVLVWADAVCINQKDADERSEQVQKMYLIYRAADLVGIWLGPEADDSSRAIALIDKLNEKGLDRETVRRTIYSSSWERHFHALVDLFERDYWDRLWVVQEVNNAKRGIVYCGDDSTSWDKYINISNILSSHRDDLQRRFPQATRRDRRSYESNLTMFGPRNVICVGGASLAYYLDYFRSRLASDPRDKLYGLLGILPSPVQHRFKPDYESSPSELYIDIVEYFLQTTGRLDIICSVHNLSHGPNLLKLPSWVPDWSQSLDFGPLGEDSMYWRGSCFRASSSVDGEFGLLGNKRRHLRMRAIYLGSIRAIGVALGKLINEVEVMMALINWWYRFIQSPTRGLESFCRTITLGQINYRDWQSVCLHIIGVLAARYVPDLQLHRDLQPNPTIQIHFNEAQDILRRDILGRVSDQGFFVTDRNDIGLTRGAFGWGHVVCIPLGVSSTDSHLHIHMNRIGGSLYPWQHNQATEDTC